MQNIKFIIKNNGLVWFMGVCECDEFVDFQNYEPDYICSILKITIERYKEIMTEIGARQNNDYFWFRTEEEVKKAIKDFEPYLIMEILTN